MMKKLIWSVSLSVVLSALVWVLTSQFTEVKKDLSPPQILEEPISKLESKKPSHNLEITNHSQTLEEKISIASRRVGQTDEEPKKTEMELENLARGLSPEEIRGLKGIALDPRHSGDERFLSLELLGLRALSSEGTSIIEDLKEIALKAELNTPGLGPILPLRAIEALSETPHKNQARLALKEILERTDSSLLNDRSMRALKHLDGEAPSLETQDNEALKKLIH